MAMIKRLFGKLNCSLGMILAIGMVGATPASATGLLELNTNDGKQTILSIGSVPVKKTKPLDLGVLRTGDAQLPGGLLSRSERMSMRARLALQRQKAVSKASRKSSNKRKRSDRNAKPSAPNPREGEVVYSDDNQPVLQ